MRTIPSPIPPYHRPVRVVDEQWLTGDGDVSLTVKQTYLDSITPKEGNLPFEVTMPDGSYQRQLHQIFLPKKNEMQTAAFIVRGRFVNYGALWFGRYAASAVLEWDGSAWHVLAGTAVDDGGGIPQPGPVDATGAWARIKNGVLQLKSPDNGLWYDVFSRVMGGAVTLAPEGPGSPT